MNKKTALIIILVLGPLVYLSGYLIGLTHGTGYTQCLDFAHMEIRRCL